MTGSYTQRQKRLLHTQTFDSKQTPQERDSAGLKETNRTANSPEALQHSNATKSVKRDKFEFPGRAPRFATTTTDILWQHESSTIWQQAMVMTKTGARTRHKGATQGFFTSKLRRVKQNPQQELRLLCNGKSTRIATSNVSYRLLCAMGGYTTTAKKSHTSQVAEFLSRFGTCNFRQALYRHLRPFCTYMLATY